MSEKRSSCADEERKKKMKDVDDHFDGWEAAIDHEDPAATEFTGILSSLSTRTHLKDDKEFSSSVSSDHYLASDQLIKQKQSLSSSAGFSSSGDSKSPIFEKILTRDDVFYCRLVIPLESGREFLPGPSKYGGKYDLTELLVVDHEKQMWSFWASFDELSNSYLFWDNWDKYVKRYGLKPDDVIFFYEDPDDDSRLLIQFQKL